MDIMPPSSGWKLLYYVEDRNRSFLWIVGAYAPNYTASHPRSE
jgi:hypothetical protein